MRKKIGSFLAFGTVCVISTFLVKPVTVVEVMGTSSGQVQIEGWIQTDQSGPRVGLEGRTTPFRLALQGTDVQARLTARVKNQRFQVRAVQKRAWVPLVLVQAAGSRISLDGKGSHLGMRAR